MMMKNMHHNILGSRVLKTSLVLLFSIFCKFSFAQDVYVHNHDVLPGYVSPALTGMYFGERMDYRAMVNYSHTTLGSELNNMSTAFAGFDTQISGIGIGGYVINSNEGGGTFNRFNGAVSAAYRISVDRMYRHNLFGGVQMGFMHHYFDRTKLVFESQYSAQMGGFDPFIESGEYFERNQIMNFDLGLGTFYEFRDLRKIYNPFAGLAFYHSVSPVNSYYNKLSKYPVRITSVAGVKLNLKETFQLVPQVMLFRQAFNSIYEIKVNGIYSTLRQDKKFLAGISYGSNDLMTVHTGFQDRSFMFRLSYALPANLMNEVPGFSKTIEVSIIYFRLTQSHASF